MQIVMLDVVERNATLQETTLVNETILLTRGKELMTDMQSYIVVFLI
jgi:hypothetical protein